MGDVTQQTATLRTNEGDIVVNLFPDHAPKTVENFAGLRRAEGVRQAQRERRRFTGPFYDGSVFHRVIAGFMIQGGDPPAPAWAAPATSSATSSTPS